MSIWDNVKYWFGKSGVDVYDLQDDYEIKQLGALIVPERLTDKNAFTLANSVTELFFPIDFYADRISKLRFFIQNSKGEEIKTELNRLISNEINPLYSFTDLIYNYVFSLLADGNAINYLGIPNIYKSIAPETIERWDVLQPNMVTLQEANNVSSLNVKSWNELIKSAKYDENAIKTTQLEVQNLVIQNYSTRRKANSLVLAKSPLFAVNKSIDVLLAVYSARYNVYANNGAAGYLAKKVSKQETYEEMVLTGDQHDQILKDINNRNGITGRKNIWGISGVPIEFVKTLATISELMPLEETLENAIKIAAIFQIPPVLVPRKDQSTYDNQENAEVMVWENGLLSMANTVCDNLTRMFRLGKYGKIAFDTDNVSALVSNESDDQDLIMKKLSNLDKIKTLNPDIDILDSVNEIYNEYGT